MKQSCSDYEYRKEDKIHQIVLTGGPCSGKTTALNYLFEKLRDRGFRVFIVPEVATMIIGGGVPDISGIEKENPKKYLKIEECMFQMQLMLENQFHKLASEFSDEPRVILCDRGLKDVEAYIGPKNFNAMLEDLNYNLSHIYRRYDGVIDLITAADGAAEFYTLENNKARQEKDLNVAIKNDKSVRDAWVGHPHLWIVDNSTDFEQKLKRVLQSISRVLGIPVPIEKERRFLLEALPDFNDRVFKDIKVQKILIEQMYLMSHEQDEEIRIRKRSQQGSSNYYRTTKIRTGKWPIEKETSISARDYIALQDLRDPAKKTIHKNRHCFVYKNQYLELDHFLNPQKGLVILEIELTEENDRVEIPPFLEVAKEITDDKSYSNYAIASKD